MKSVFGVSPGWLLLVQGYTISMHLVSCPPMVSNCVFARIPRTIIIILTPLFLKCCPLLRMSRGAGCWQLKQRLSPVHTRNRLRIFQSATSDSSIVQMEIVRSTNQTSHIFCLYTPSTIQSALGTFLISSQPTYRSSWYHPFLSGTPKWGHLCRGSFLNMYKK